MRIVADENLANVEDLFSPLGDLVCRPGRHLGPGDVSGADILLVRSVTRVDERLLAGSRVRFVGTATIGTDHLDLDWLAHAGIKVVSAPGCNARGVAEYVLAALSRLRLSGKLDWRREIYGVVGLGNVGGLVARTLRQMGLRVLGCDPHVRHPDIIQADLDQLLTEASVILLHTPLVRTGSHPTLHLLNRERLSRLGRRRILLNAGRGDVIDNSALRMLIRTGDIDPSRVVLDVWEGEPEPDPCLVSEVAIATPHIAGYSVEGRLRGSLMVRDGLLDFLGRGGEETWRFPDVPGKLEVSPGDPWDALSRLILEAYPIQDDDREMKNAMRTAVNAGQVFDRLRRQYWERHEFSTRRIAASDRIGAETLSLARMAGFTAGPA